MELQYHTSVLNCTRSYTGFSRVTVPYCLHIPQGRPTKSVNPNRNPGIKNASKYTSLAKTLVSDKSEGYDVYVYEPERLDEGVRKHILSVFVADESGLINRVAGVFARRGANIESLAVGLTKDKALFTIVATGTDATVANLTKQLAKLVNVRYVEDITDQKYIPSTSKPYIQTLPSCMIQHAEREFMLIKVKAPPGTARTEICQLAQIFRAHIVDVGDQTLGMTVTGDPGKMAAFTQVLSNFGIVELVRTGRIALKRGEEVFQANADSSSSSMDEAPERKRKIRYAPAPDDKDVYGGESSDDEGVWNVNNILEAAYQTEDLEYDPYTLSIDVEDVPGVLNQVTGVIARRGFNVQSLAVGNSEKEGMSRITLVVPGDDSSIANLKKQILKLVYVDSVTELNSIPHVARELMLIKIKCNAHQRGEVRDIADIFHGNVCDISKTTLTLEFMGKEEKMLAIQDVLGEYGIMEIARTGSVALARESGVDTRYLSAMQGTRVML